MQLTNANLNGSLVNPIIPIYKHKIIALGIAYPGSPRGGCSPVLLMDDADAGILCRIGITHGGAAVRRAVVHQNHFQIPIGLVQHAIHALGKVRFDPINGNDHTDFHRCSAPASNRK